MVATVNVADIFPGATATVAGVVAEFVLLERDTISPAEPVGPLSVTVPTVELPPRTDVGLTLIDTSVAGVTVRVAVADWGPLVRFWVALITAGVLVLTITVVIVNAAVV